MTRQNQDNIALEELLSTFAQVLYKADLDGDSLLDKKELALWLHKNELINKATEIKGDFWVSCSNKPRK